MELPESTQLEDRARQAGDGQRAAPSVGDPLWGEQAGGYNPAGVLASFSTHIGDWLIRSVIDDDDVEFIINEMAQINAVHKGRTDMKELIWKYLGLKPAVGGKAREQVVQVLTATRLQRMNQGLGIFDRLRNPENAREGPK